MGKEVWDQEQGGQLHGQAFEETIKSVLKFQSGSLGLSHSYSALKFSRAKLHVQPHPARQLLRLWSRAAQVLFI